MVMADRPKTPMTDREGGARSVALFALWRQVLLVLLVLVGMGNFGTKKCPGYSAAENRVTGNDWFAEPVTNARLKLGAFRQPR
jgi:hypothetical protein